MNSVTSAMLRDGRPEEPAKITSSISVPRTEVGRVSPLTQRSAANKVDLPQPFGPTTAVRPGSTKSSVGSTNDLNPESLSRVNFNGNAPPYARWNARLFRRELLVEEILPVRPGDFAHALLAVDDEGRRAVAVVLRLGLVADVLNRLLLLRVSDALIDFLCAHARGRAHLNQSGVDVGDCIFRIPFGLIPVKLVNEREIVFLG